MVGLPGQVSFSGEGVCCYDSSYPGEFLCFQEELGIATKFRFHKAGLSQKTGNRESRVIAYCFKDYNVCEYV